MIKISNKVISDIEKICKSKIEEKGFEFEYAEMAKENSNNILRIVIDKDSYNLTSEDCENISRYIEDDVDKIMKDKEYILEVSSAGLEKNLKNMRLFKKYIKSMVYIKLFKKTMLTENFNEKEFQAVIEDVNEDKKEILLKLENGEAFYVNFEDIASAHTIFDFDNFFKNAKENM